MKRLMTKKTIGAVISAAALLVAAYFVAQGPAPSAEVGLFIIIVGAISALLIGGPLRRR